MSDETLPKFWETRDELDYLHKQIRELREEVNRLRLIVTDVQDQISPDRDPETGIPYGELS
jgi:hypothetical protein